MDVLQSCRCCLQGSSDKDLTIPYTYLGKTEIYADMLKECFSIHVKLVDDSSRGICWLCVDRLRDACHFKLQVQRNEAELQRALLVRVEPTVPEASDASIRDVTTVVLSDDETTENAEMDNSDEVEEVLDEEPKENLEMDNLNELEEFVDEDPLLHSEGEDYETSVSKSLEGAAAKLEQPAPARDETNGSSGLERLNSDDRQSKGRPYACKGCDQTFKNMSLLKSHILIHSLPKFSKKESLNLSTHTKNQSTFSWKEEMRKHQKGRHEFICNYCKHEFRDKSHLLTHLMLHPHERRYTCKGEKPYSCKFCDIKYSSKGLLTRHLKKHTENALLSLI